MTPLEALQGAYAMLPDRMNDPRSTLLLMAITLQENPLRLPQQVRGPAAGDYQHEEPTIGLILKNEQSRRWALAVCENLGVEPNAHSVWLAIRDGDPRLDAAFARLLLWCDSKPLPIAGDVAQGWDTYLRVWRPGAAKRDYDKLRLKWSVNYAKAMEIGR